MSAISTILRIPFYVMFIIVLTACGGGGGGSTGGGGGGGGGSTGGGGGGGTAGQVDSSFGTDGLVSHDNAAGGSGYDYGHAVIEDSSGRLLVTGYSENIDGGRNVTVWRYSSTGVLDSGFGSGGTIVLDNSTDGTGFDEGKAISLDASGNILVAANMETDSFGSDIVIWRFTSAGVLDTSFGEDYDADTFPDGYVRYGNSNFDLFYVQDMMIDSSGRILVTGAVPDFIYFIMGVIRFTGSGILDSSFGSGGIATHAAGSSDYSGGSGIGIDSTGKILVTGYRSNPVDNNNDMALWRFTASGQIDSSFGVDYDLDVSAILDGYVVYNYSGDTISSEYGIDLAIDASDNIIVVGEANKNNINADMAVWRFTSDGVPDTGFNGTGLLTVNSAAGGSTEVAEAVALDNNGKVVVTGFSWDSSINSYVTLLRINSTGTLDGNFGNNGILTNGTDHGKDVLIDANGDIVVTGRTENTTLDMAIWRFLSN